MEAKKALDGQVDWWRILHLMGPGSIPNREIEFEPTNREVSMSRWPGVGTGWLSDILDCFFFQRVPVPFPVQIDG